jgi:hypothetical protein
MERMSFTVPVVEAKFTLLPELPHGRRGLSTSGYRPHIVIGPESQCVAIREGNRLMENYLGVTFVGGPDSMEPGDAANVKLALMYFPEYPYEEVQPGVTFTVREGPLIVGYGVIQSRGMESFPLPAKCAELTRSGGSCLSPSFLTAVSFPFVLCFAVSNRLPLHVVWGIRSATSRRDSVGNHVSLSAFRIPSLNHERVLGCSATSETRRAAQEQQNQDLFHILFFLC